VRKQAQPQHFPSSTILSLLLFLFLITMPGNGAVMVAHAQILSPSEKLSHNGSYQS
jgi:hypothetical protein